LGFVPYRDVRLDPALVDEPVQHLGVSVGGVADQLFRIESDAVERTLDHALCRQHLGLTDCRRRFDIDDDRVIDVDQVVGRISKEVKRREPASLNIDQVLCVRFPDRLNASRHIDGHTLVH
jgi:hypothetical protein